MLAARDPGVAWRIFFGNTPTTKTVLIFRFGTSNIVLPLCLFLCAWAPLRALCRLQRINGLASIILWWMFSNVFIPNWISQERSVEIRVSGTRGDQRYVQIFVIGNCKEQKCQLTELLNQYLLLLLALCRLQKISGLASIILLWTYFTIFIPNWISRERSAEIRVFGTRGDQRNMRRYLWYEIDEEQKHQPFLVAKP